MTFHLFSGNGHECSNCDTTYIPYEEHLPCPRCGTSTSESFDFIGDAAAGLAIHKKEYGKYLSQAFYVGSLSEQIFHLLCQLFDSVDSADNFESAISIAIDKIDFGEQQHMRQHILDIAIRTRLALQNETA